MRKKLGDLFVWISLLAFEQWKLPVLYIVNNFLCDWVLISGFAPYYELDNAKLGRRSFPVVCGAHFAKPGTCCNVTGEENIRLGAGGSNNK